MHLGAAEKADWEGEKQKARTRKSDSPKSCLEDELGTREEEQEGRAEARRSQRGLEAGPGPSREARGATDGASSDGDLQLSARGLAGRLQGARGLKEGLL